MEPYHEYTVEDLAFWATQEPARRFTVEWLSRPRSTPLTCKGGFQVKVWSNRSKTKKNDNQPYIYRGRSWDLNRAIRQALSLFGETLR